MTDDEEKLDVEVDTELEPIETPLIELEENEFDQEDFDDDFDEDFEEEVDDGYDVLPADANGL